MTFYKHLSKILQKAAKGLRRLKNEGQMQFVSHCPTALVCCSPSFLPFLTGTCQLSGLIEKNNQKTKILTTLTENQWLTASFKDIK